MNACFAAAAALLFATGSVHTIFGERLVFRRMRPGGVIPTHGGQLLREPHVRILWASWHMVTVQGWLVAGVLAWLALPEQAGLADSFITRAIVAATLACSALVCVGTQARHPGWIALLVAGLLTIMGIQ